MAVAGEDGVIAEFRMDPEDYKIAKQCYDVGCGGRRGKQTRTVRLRVLTVKLRFDSVGQQCHP